MMGYTSSRCITRPSILEEISFEQKRKQVGILGGNFNPIHQGHLIIADQAYHQLGLDEIYLLPSFIPPHVDEKKTISAEFREEMLYIAIENDPHLRIERTELKREGKSFTFDTMKTLTEENPDTDYFFIIGGDMVEYLPKWYKIDELVQLVQFVGVKRSDCSTLTKYPIIWIDVPLIDISSTTIRKKIQSGCSVRYLLPDDVISYISLKGLYINDRE